MRFCRLCAAAAAAIIFPAASYGAPITLLSDSFADGGATNGADPLDALWRTYGTSNSLDTPLPADTTTGPNEGAPDFCLRNNPGSQQARGVYASWGSLTTLAVGDTLSLSFDLRSEVANGTAAGIRFGLYNSLTTPLVDDDVGYSGRFSMSPSTAASAAEESSGEDQPLTGGTVTVLSGSNVGAGPASVTTASMRMGMLLERTATGISGTLLQNGNSV